VSLDIVSSAADVMANGQTVNPLFLDCFSVFMMFSPEESS